MMPVEYTEAYIIRNEPETEIAMPKTFLSKQKDKISSFSSANPLSTATNKPVVITSAEEWDSDIFKGKTTSPLKKKAEGLLREISDMAPSLEQEIPEETAIRLSDHLAEKHFLRIPNVIGEWEYDIQRYDGCRERNSVLKSYLNHDGNGDTSLLQYLIKETKNADCSKSLKIKVSGNRIELRQEYPDGWGSGSEHREAEKELRNNTALLSDSHSKAISEIDWFNDSVRHTCRTAFGLEGEK